MVCGWFGWFLGGLDGLQVVPSFTAKAFWIRYKKRTTRYIQTYAHLNKVNAHIKEVITDCESWFAASMATLRLYWQNATFV